MILTDNDEWAERARHLTTQAKKDPVRYVHDEVGYNYRLTNVQAAIGVAQLEQLENFIDIKHKNYEIYKSEIEKIDGLELCTTPPYARNNLWFYTMKIDEEVYGMSSEKLMTKLSDHGIQTRPIWELNHRQDMYNDAVNYNIVHALDVIAETVNLPCSISLDSIQIEAIKEQFYGI
jgi:dTDP-4-amino-4,6-dideoxygalactose transaminase